LIFKAICTAPLKNSATFSKSSSVKPLDVSAGVPESFRNAEVVSALKQFQ
jgi:hypothetical protein